MLKKLGDFFEYFAHHAPHIPRPFNQLWEALGRTEQQAPPDDGEENGASGTS